LKGSGLGDENLDKLDFDLAGEAPMFKLLNF
jgi:hypothetical protein